MAKTAGTKRRIACRHRRNAIESGQGHRTGSIRTARRVCAGRAGKFQDPRPRRRMRPHRGGRRYRPGPPDPSPGSIQRARKPPPKASPAPTVSTIETLGIDDLDDAFRRHDEDGIRPVGDDHDRRTRDRGWPAPPPTGSRSGGEVGEVLDTDLDHVGTDLDPSRAGRDTPRGRGSPVACSSGRA